MALKPEEKHAPVYRAAARFVDVGLRQGTSLFSADAKVWIPSVIEDFHRRFVLQPAESDRDFITKFRAQLRDAPDETIQLAAEILYVHLLAPCVIGAAAKRALVGTVLGWASKKVEVSADLDDAFESCILTDMSFNLQRPFFLAYLANFARVWWDEAADARSRALEDPWVFKALAMSVPMDKAFGQREVLLHLVHPEWFEPISSRKHKERIARVFEERVDLPTSEDLDKRLLAIRSSLERDFGKGFSYYRADVRPLWQKDREGGEGQWGEFILWIARILQWQGLDEGERNYKVEVAQLVTAAQQSIEDPNWLSALRKAFQSSKNNLTSWMTHDRFLRWCEAEPDTARAALRVLWQDSPAPAARLASFASQVPKQVLPRVSEQAQIGSFLLMGQDPQANPMVRATPFKRAFVLAGQPHPHKGSDVKGYYEYILDFLDRVGAAAAKAGARVRDRLDVQGALWVLTKWEQPPSDWSESDKKAFVKFRGGVSGEEQPPDGPLPGDETDISALAADLLIDTEYLEEMVDLIQEKKQAVFYGPPGTGKTYVAQRLAAYIAGRPDRVALVQFHSAYSYEDFVEGYRPTAGAGFVLQPGPLRRVAERAAANPSEAFVLIIDEINRANVAKVLGELYFLLEYRDAQVTPAYRPDQLMSLPQNLYFIGTMNTADRSIALLDSALRRRFYFFPFFPDQKPVEGLLRRWFRRSDGQPEFEWVADVVDEVNARLRTLSGGRHLAIGPSHFIKENLTEITVERIWKHAVLPQLEEVFFGEEDRLSGFALEKVRLAVRGKGEGAGDEDPAEREQA